ncbi:SCO family protein [Vineibacter terrae]|uniref:SCO family protein n=1 Tax=Vineibacter terrae TaxID=2586908 RepID=A0A5C8PVE9_9HYPH|nr:SCO family protein [Vineibacter terrae]TXL81889.1 SCO family protein [Vineibacter terrae]
MSRNAKLALAAWIVVLIGFAGWIGVQFSQDSGGGPTIGGPFTLTDHNGKRVTEADFKGKPTLIYFGFTYCPDVCPTSLLLMQTAVEQLGKDADKNVNMLLITVDPERDTPAVLKDYVGNFGPTIVGLTGSPDDIAAAAKAFRVYYRKVEGKDGAPYLMDHSSIFYLLDKRGRFVKHFTHQSRAEDIAAAIKPLM